MTKDILLRLIAESAYNVGYAAKKHLATFDIVEKVPGWISLLSFAIGILALYIPDFEQKHVSAGFLIIGVAGLYINFYQNEKDRYGKAGGDLTKKFHEFRILYQEVKSLAPTDDVSPYLERHNRTLDEASQLGFPKQIFLSDWYAHYKFFWQMQTGWMEDELKWSLFRDKIPFGATALLVGAVAVVAFVLVKVLMNG